MHTFTRLANGVFAFLQQCRVWHSNAGVIVSDDDVLVIDSLTNEAMVNTLLSEIQGVTDKKIAFLINTHSHPDHTFTNHLFPSATTICSRAGREWSQRFLSKQDVLLHEFAELFPDISFEGSKYTLQNLTFENNLSFYRNNREIRLIELGPGHSESDVIVYVPQEKIVFCGDVFMNGLPPLPSEGRISSTIANLMSLESLNADIYVPGHGEIGRLKDIVEYRCLMESIQAQAHMCFDKGLSYDEAVQSFGAGSTPLPFIKPSLLSCYYEFNGRQPKSQHPPDLDHMQLLRGVAEQERLDRLYGKK
jgi:cyclase